MPAVPPAHPPGCIMVIGGNGFIGREICRIAAQAGHRVLALSRSGPPADLLPGFPEVEWIRGDVFEPQGWREHLASCEAVIHSLGAITEDPAQGRTLERLNGDSAIVAATEAQLAGVAKFVFLSAGLNPPGVGRGYLVGKRKAERFLATLAMPSAILRPALAIGRRRPWTLTLGKMLGIAPRLPLVGSRLGRIRPLPVDAIARAAYRAAIDPDLVGILEVDRIATLGTMLSEAP
ncbi:MAG: NAD(P)H-binding protein [Cyanobacteria bacterium REEB65]|nr:NAD(P)H-binding protein [Cyanobacteria bacterium REEB65]